MPPALDAVGLGRVAVGRRRRHPQLRAGHAADWAIVGASKSVDSGRSMAYRFFMFVNSRTAMSE
jgi:hypothetical protein